MDRPLSKLVVGLVLLLLLPVVFASDYQDDDDDDHYVIPGANCDFPGHDPAVRDEDPEHPPNYHHGEIDEAHEYRAFENWWTNNQITDPANPLYANAVEFRKYLWSLLHPEGVTGTLRPGFEIPKFILLYHARVETGEDVEDFENNDLYGPEGDNLERGGHEIRFTGGSADGTQPFTMHMHRCPWCGYVDDNHNVGLEGGVGGDTDDDDFIRWWNDANGGRLVNSNRVGAPVGQNIVFFSVYVQIPADIPHMVQGGQSGTARCFVEQVLNDPPTQPDNFRMWIGGPGLFLQPPSFTVDTLPTFDIASPVDGDASTADCQTVTGSNTNYVNGGGCCGDDLGDHGAADARWSVTPTSQPRPLPSEATVSRTQNYNLHGNRRFCNNVEALGPTGWVEVANTNAGQIYSLRGREYLSTGDTTTGFNGGQDSSGSPSCTRQDLQIDSNQYSYYHVPSTDTSAKAGDRGHWHQCAGTETDGTNDITTGGKNRVIGERISCGNTEYVCARTDTNQFQWVRTQDLSGDACSQINNEGYQGFTWTGTRCCYGDQTYHDPSAPDTVDTTAFSENGICLEGTHYANDLPNEFGRIEDNYVASFGTSFACRSIPLSNSLTSNHISTCSVVNHSQSGPPQSAFYCGYTGGWQAFPGNVRVDDPSALAADAIIASSTAPDGFNLLPNPSFAGGGSS